MAKGEASHWLGGPDLGPAWQIKYRAQRGRRGRGGGGEIFSPAVTSPSHLKLPTTLLGRHHLAAPRSATSYFPYNRPSLRPTSAPPPFLWLADCLRCIDASSLSSFCHRYCVRSTAAVRFGALWSLESAFPIATSALSPKTTPGGANGSFLWEDLRLGSRGKAGCKGRSRRGKGFQVEEGRSVSRAEQRRGVAYSCDEVCF